MARYEMSGGATFWYYFINIFTLGSLYFMKIATKKALTEVAYEHPPAQAAPKSRS